MKKKYTRLSTDSQSKHGKQTSSVVSRQDKRDINSRTALQCEDGYSRDEIDDDQLEEDLQRNREGNLDNDEEKKMVWTGLWTSLLLFYTVMEMRLHSLNNSPRELYINFFLKFCESYCYFSLSQILVIYLHDEFGVSDVEAGTMYGMWGAAITFWGLTTSWINDNLGVRKSLLIGSSLSGLVTLMIACTTSKNTLYICLLALLPIGNSMGMPMLTIGIKRYTTAVNRGFAFGLYYAVMNVAAFVSGPIVDVFNIGTDGIQIGSLHLSGNRLVILTTTFTYMVSFLTTWSSLREIRVSDESDDQLKVGVIDNANAFRSDTSDSVELELALREEHNQPQDICVDCPDTDNETPAADRNQYTALLSQSDSIPSTGPGSTAYRTTSDSPDIRNEAYAPVNRSLASTASELCRSPTFWRFSLLTMLLINLRTIFRHLDATLPTYLIRCFGDNYPKGMIYSINPFMIIWLTPLVSALTTTWPHFDMIKYGGYVSAISPVFMAFSTSTWAVVLFVVILSLGEAIWSPRLYDYTMSIAPEVRSLTYREQILYN